MSGSVRYAPPAGLPNGPAPAGPIDGLPHSNTEFQSGDGTPNGLVDVYSQIGPKTTGHDLSLVVGGTADIGFRHLPGGTGNMMLEIDAMVPTAVAARGWTIKQQDGSAHVQFPSSGGQINFSSKIIGNNGANKDLYIGSGAAAGNVYIQNGSGAIKWAVAEATGPVTYSTTATSNADSFYVSGEANPRYVVRADGLVRWGAGGASAVDTQLSRAAAGVLAVGAAQCLKTGLAATASRPSASAVTQGAQFFDTTLNKPIWSDGASWRDATGTVV